ncbi:MAG: hypothetical protein JJU11_01760 [Candidatus Sumerlaeia bacterium]|nr:hypothetical protein [Candidatus Sumerlaeia bacterium]
MRMKSPSSGSVQLTIMATVATLAMFLLVPSSSQAQPATDPRSIEIQQAQDTLRLLFSRDQYEEVVLQAEALMDYDDGNPTAVLLKARAETRIALRDTPEPAGTARIPRPPMVPTSMTRAPIERVPAPVTPPVEQVPSDVPVPQPITDEVSEAPPPVAEPGSGLIDDPGPVEPSPVDPEAAAPVVADPAAADPVVPAAQPAAPQPSGTSLLARAQDNMLYIGAGILLLIVILFVAVFFMRKRSAASDVQPSTGAPSSASLTAPPQAKPATRSMAGGVLSKDVMNEQKTVEDISSLDDDDIGVASDLPTSQGDPETAFPDKQTAVADQPTGMPDQPTGVPDQPTGQPDQPTGQRDPETAIADKPTMVDTSSAETTLDTPEYKGASGESPTVELDADDTKASDSQADDVQETTGGGSFVQAPPPVEPDKAKDDTIDLDISGGQDTSAEDTDSPAVDMDVFAGSPPPTDGPSDDDDGEKTFNSLMFGSGDETKLDSPQAADEDDDGDQTFNSLMFGAGDETNISPPPAGPPKAPRTAGEQDDKESTKPLPGMEPSKEAPKEEKAPAAAGGRGNLFERQRQAGIEAMEAGDFGKAVQCLSVAASLKPGDKEVREFLDEARKKRRSN